MKRIFKYTWLVLVVASFMACDSKLNLNPKDSIIDEDAFQSIEDVQDGMIGVYASLNAHTVVAISSRASDDLRLSAQNRGQGIAIHNWEFTASVGEFYSMWRDMYHTIDRANRMLEVAAKFDVEDQRIKQVMGECYFIRAYCHFELMRAYTMNFDAADAMGVPFMANSVISNPVRDSQTEVYTNVKADLQEAIALMNDEFTSNIATEIAANALMARVALYERNYDDAIAYASTVIDQSGMRLANIDEVEKIWDDAFALNEKAEVIFKLSRVEGSPALGNIFSDASNGELYFSPSNDLQNQYTADDVRADVYFGVNSQSNETVNKHDGKGVGPNIVDLKALRLSEVFLIRAEAYIMKNMLTEGAEDLNNLRSTRISMPTAAPDSDQATALAFLQEERRRELAYEGHRYIDLKRWGLGIKRLPEDTELASGIELEAGDFRFVFPIPQNEMFANDNMEQNKGYN
ncbi:RagB/SusD family nutrient uptake outer membrane protein [Carboxylicivirga sp. M1479]|uniref:RagB/SusD family nutrient uptake outer membrane protein n=1 Tax=Carboxylicivirga sp. M1479 TaxID=2594476 RepID=UPI0011788C8E|nr:RagB/SusD family nutrient uptake outer membrane protein [Carboxylicivirga sp. M1479]TRX63324.1 RagB/SusD family nutrient uptake outer membrane protein [Carboxylicivirga sp. M1479]